MIFNPVSMSLEDSGREDGDRGASLPKKAWKAVGWTLEQLYFDPEHHFSHRSRSDFVSIYFMPTSF